MHIKGEKVVNAKVRSFLLKAFYIVFSVQVLLIIFLAFSRPLYGLFSGQLIIGAAIASGFFLAGIIIWNLLSKKIEDRSKVSNICFVIALVLLTTLLVITAIIHGNHYDVAGDYEFVYISADELARGIEPEGKFRNYFMVFGNNTRSMLILSVLFRLGYIFGIPEYVPALVRNLLLIVGSVLAIGYLLSQDKLKKYRIPAVLMIAVCLPVYSFTPTFYTDSASLGLGVIAFALMLKYFKTDGKIRFFFVFAAGFFTVIGITEKVTTLIPLIAGVISVLIIEKVKMRRVIFAGVVIAIFSFLVNIWAGQYSIDSESREKANPILSWVALGMHGDGSFADNVDFSESLAKLESKEQKYEYTRRYINENLKEAFTIEHILKKITVSYAEGTFQSADYLTKSEIGHDWVWEHLHPYGKYVWRGTKYCFIYISVIYIFLFLGSVLTVIDLFRGKSVSTVKFAADLSFMGIFVFLLIWESANRQLYNQFPMILIALFENVSVCLTHLKRLSKRNRGLGSNHTDRVSFTD